jgi:hypothetical protein
MMTLLIGAGVLGVVAVAGSIVGMARDGYGWTRRRECTPEPRQF